MWNILKNSEIIKFFLEAKFSCTEYSPDLFQIMAKKDNDRNFNILFQFSLVWNQVKLSGLNWYIQTWKTHSKNVNINNWRKAYKNSCYCGPQGFHVTN